MTEKTTYFKLGLFIISATIIAIVGVIVLGAGTLFRKKLFVETYFEESVQGLEVGSPLKFRGFRIGKIDEIAMVGKEYFTEYRYILVRSSIFPDAVAFKTGKITKETIKPEIDRGLRARLGFQGLTGTAHLELDYVEADSYAPLKIDWDPEYVYIPSVPSTITRVSEAINRIMKGLERINFEVITTDLQKASNALAKTLDSVNIQNIAVEIEGLLKEVRDTNQSLGRFLKGHELESFFSEASETIVAMRRVTEATEKPLQEMLSEFSKTAREVSVLAKKLEIAADDLPESLDKLKAITRRMEKLIAGQQQDIETTIENIRLISENVRDITENAKKYPSQLFFGKPPATLDKTVK